MKSKSMNVCCLFLIIYLLLFTATNVQSHLEGRHFHGRLVKQSLPSLTEDIRYKWNLLEFGFNNENDKRSALESGQLLTGKGVPIDVQPYYDRNGKLKVFVTIPRFENGIPYTLASLGNDELGSNNNDSPQLQPYPNFDWHNSRNVNDCNKLTSVFRVALSGCDQMWVLDSGVIAGKQICPPQLLLIDLLTDQLLHVYRFDESLYAPSVSLFVTPVVYVSDPFPLGNCSQVKVYSADVTNHGLVVYDHQMNRAWRIEHKYMYPDPDVGTHRIANHQFTLMDGIIGMAADKANLYFHAMASLNDYSISLNLINNETIFLNNNINAAENDFRMVGKRSSACVPMSLDSKGNMYCITFKPIELFIWNTQQIPYNQYNTQRLPLNDEHYQFVSGMKIVRNPLGKEELWVLSNRLQLELAAGGYNDSQINFRIIRLPCFDNSKLWA